MIRTLCLFRQSLLTHCHKALEIYRSSARFFKPGSYSIQLISILTGGGYDSPAMIHPRSQNNLGNLSRKRVHEITTLRNIKKQTIYKFSSPLCDYRIIAEESTGHPVLRSDHLSDHFCDKGSLGAQSSTYVTIFSVFLKRSEKCVDLKLPVREVSSSMYTRVSFRTARID